MRFLKHPATVIATAALLVAVGGGTAAYASGLINGSQIKNHSISKNKLTKKAIKQLKGNRGPRGATGATGAPGATGATGAPGAKGATGSPGAPGAPGSPGFVSVGGFSGGIATIVPDGGSGAFVFAGPVATLTTTASQSIVASGSSALGSAAGTSASITVCASPTGANTPVPLDSSPFGAFTDVSVTSTRLSYAASATGSPGAGTWDVGMCVDNFGANNIDDTDFSVGYAFVVNGTPVSEAPKSASKSSAHHG